MEEDCKAHDLYVKLFSKGKWPGKPSVSAWFGSAHTPWRDRQGRYQRAVTGLHDAELLTRYEVQQNPPDLLITNYSMLEYMMMRPIERTIFDRTRDWLHRCPNEKIMIVLDESSSLSRCAGSRSRATAAAASRASGRRPRAITSHLCHGELQ